MLWSELLAELDEIRVYLRNSRKAKDTVQEGDEILTRLSALASRAAAPSLHVEPQPVFVDPVSLTLPEEQPPVIAPHVKYVEERSNGEGRMIVMGRDKPFVPRKPTLEEVFDEKELGK